MDEDNKLGSSNLWESARSNDYIYFSSVEELLKYLDENKRDLIFKTKKEYKSGDYCESKFEESLNGKVSHFTYTDETHPIAISKRYVREAYINPDFFEAHKEAFIQYAKKKFEEKLNTLGINPIVDLCFPDFIFDNDLLTMIISNIRSRRHIFTLEECDKEVNLTNEQIALLKDNHIDLGIWHRFKEFEGVEEFGVLDDIGIGHYTIMQLKNDNSFEISIPIKEEEIDNFICIDENATIKFKLPDNSKKDELYFFKYIANILKRLTNHNRKYNIVIPVDNRQLLNQSGLLNSVSSNINLTIRSRYDDTLETYQKQEEILEKLAKPIRDSNLSPLEKCIAVYNIVKQFKEYKKNINKHELCSNLKYVLDDDNEYIACAGFANFLEELLTRVGIPNMRLGVYVDTSYDDEFTVEEKNIDIVGHARNLVRIDDDKYDIHGYYVADSTWDNDMDRDLYLHFLMTFNHIKESHRLEKLNDEDLLLDFNNIADFKNKINYFLEKEVRVQRERFRDELEQYKLAIDHASGRDEKKRLYSEMNKKSIEIYNKCYIKAYEVIYKKILTILYRLDKEKYDYFYDKYNDKFNNFDMPLEQIERLMNELTYEYANYIIPLTNKEVPLDTILKAAKVVKREINGLTEEEIDYWYDVADEDNYFFEDLYFPYQYDPNNNTEAYVERKNSHGR